MDLTFSINNSEIIKFTYINVCNNFQKYHSNLVLYLDHTPHPISNIIFSTKIFRSSYLMLQTDKCIIIIEAFIPKKNIKKKATKKEEKAIKKQPILQ
jgi:hypothetical protein